MLSIIIPVYNVDKYVKECLESIDVAIKNISFDHNVEVIIVNDGSTDSSREIVERYIETKQRTFQLHNQTNKGVAEARNKGLSLATKKYVTFVDPDDLVSPEYLRRIFTIIEKQEIDLIVWDCERVSFDLKEKLGIFKGCDPNMLSSKWLVNGSLCTKVFKSELVKDLRFTPGLIYEDTEFVYRAIANCSTYHIIDEELYFYRIGRKNSITTNWNTKVDDIYKVLDSIFEYYNDDVNQTDQDYFGLEYQFIKILLWSNLFRQIKFSGINIFEGARRITDAKKYLNLHFPKWQSNQFLQNSLYFKELMGENYEKYLALLGKSIFKTYYVILSIQLFKRKIIK
ncbi:glycosyltransferase [Streptococcus suis]|nr:glycosyltransferase [Streptococcus suis]